MTCVTNLASDLRQRGDLWRMTEGPDRDGLGQRPALPEKVGTFWCAVVPQTGSLLSGRPAETVVSSTTHKIYLRYRPGITPDMWMVVEGVRYDIQYVLDPYLTHTVLELFCEVRQDGAGEVDGDG